MSKKKFVFGAAGTLVGMLGVGAACAQTTGTSPPTGATGPTNETGQSSGELMEIQVTALRRSEPLLKAPAAITAISGDQLSERGIVTVQDLQDIVPGVQMTTTGNGVNIVIRGIQTTDTSAKGEQDIAFNVDGVSYGRGLERTTAFFDIQRVEVLRGPQGTLYGQSSTGGAVNIITNKPDLTEAGGYVKVEYGNYDTVRTEAAVNIPVINDMLGVRIAGATNKRDGYSVPIGYSTTVAGTTYDISADGAPRKNDQDDKTIRTTVLFKPSDALTARIAATIGSQGGTGIGFQPDDFLVKNSLSIFANPIPAYNDNHFANVDGNITALVGSVQIDAMASHQRETINDQFTDDEIVNYNYAYGGGNGFFFSDAVNKFTTNQYEVRFSNADPGVIDYVAGANYIFEDLLENGRNWQSPIATAGDPSTYEHTFEVNNETTHKSEGVFGQITWHATEQLGVVLGARYTKDSTSRDGYIAPPLPFYACNTPGFYPKPCFPSPGDQAAPPSGAGGLADDGRGSANKITYRVGLNYQMDNNNLIYGDVATGFKGPGFNDYSPATGGTAAYGASSLTAFEVGYKGHPVSGVTLTSDVYYYDFQKDQITGVVTFPAAGTTDIYTVSTPATIYGWENELSYQLQPHTVVSGTLALEHSSFKNYQAGDIFGDTVNWSGQSLDQTPKVVVTLGLDQAFPLANGAEIRFHGISKWSDSYLLSDYGNAVRYTQGSFTRSDLSLMYATAHDKYTVQLFVQNIEDKVQRTSEITGYPTSCPYGGVGGQCVSGGVPTYPTPGNGSVGNTPYGYLNFTTNTPRFFGVRLSAKF